MDIRAIKTCVVSKRVTGNIFIENAKKFSNLNIIGVAWYDVSLIRSMTEEVNLKAYSFEEMLEDADIEMVLLLTTLDAHYEEIKKILNAGKHVYVDKPLTDSLQKADELVKLARQKNLFIACGPDTPFGACIQTVRKAIDDGLIGEVTSFAACANRDNNLLCSYFPHVLIPGEGIIYNYTIYYMNAIVDILGPVARTSAFKRAPYPVYKDINPESKTFGQDLIFPNESEVTAIVELRSGVTGTLTMNADTIMNSSENRIMFSGTKGILIMGDPNFFGSKVWLLRDGEGGSREELSFVNPYDKNDCWGICAADLGFAISSGREARNVNERIYHIFETLSSLHKSAETGIVQTVSSTCTRPLPLYEKLEN